MNDEQLLRYSRQILLPQIDIIGQTRLLESRVLIIGLGGLGSPAAMYLASAGIGHLILNDDDCVDLSNLQRQILHGTASIGERKTASARKTLAALNPNITLEALDERLTEEALMAIAHQVDLILDCSDNLSTRHRVNRVSVATGTPLVSGAAIRFEGQIAVFDPASPKSPCYNCLYIESEEGTDTCSRNGVIAPLPGIIGSLQALEAIKVLVSPADAMTGHLLLFDAWQSEWRRIKLSRNPDCPTCGSPDFPIKAISDEFSV